MESPLLKVLYTGRHASRTDGSVEMITVAQAAQIYGHASCTDGSAEQLEIEFCM